MKGMVEDYNICNQKFNYLMEPFSVGGQNTPAKCHCKFGSDETGQCYQNLTLMGFNRSPEKCHIHSTEQQCNADKDWCKWH